MILTIKNVYHQFGTNRVLHDINLKINPGQFVALTGPSGCGKSTLFQAILGTHPPSQGEVLLGDKEITGPSRDIGIVYQQYSLFDWLGSTRNVATGLKWDQTNIPYRLFCYLGWRKKRKLQLEEARQLLCTLGLENACGQLPSQLSGGMRQRVAIAQALIMRPKLLLLDEPFTGLDEPMCKMVSQMLLKLYKVNLDAKKAGQEPPYTVIFVTHEQDRAFYIADRVVGLSRFWKDGYMEGNECGSTVTYDKATPCFGPDEPIDYTRFADLKKLLNETALNPKWCGNPKENCTFWSDLAQGNGTGISKMAGVSAER